ncbi:hypothetical protein TELCIR_11682 [Teladorsagia circumcincta]|uniref:Protein kinase domain-containing protein n=1 Tax=Teladorsagia circumcincta TaxID=45464 RepID=A0A2G9UA37_TELCI|nr:hypothetical protein TELCIR_11682 [Teladorsagia circumcincta]
MDWIETENTAYIVMELVAGGELFDRIVDEKWNGMYLHDRGITHRDIKPENILCMTKEDYTLVKLADFGLAKGNDASTLKTYCGTPAYMAPEMIDNDRLPYNPKVDMWSLGVVLFTGICGYPPFSDDYADMDLKSQIKTGRLVFQNQWKYVTLETQFVIKSMLRVDGLVLAITLFHSRGILSSMLALDSMNAHNMGDHVAKEEPFREQKGGGLHVVKQEVDEEAGPLFSIFSSVAETNWVGAGGEIQH